jgi:hypothetical protein
MATSIGVYPKPIQSRFKADCMSPPRAGNQDQAPGQSSIGVSAATCVQVRAARRRIWPTVPGTARKGTPLLSDTAGVRYPSRKLWRRRVNW